MTHPLRSSITHVFTAVTPFQELISDGSSGGKGASSLLLTTCQLLSSILVPYIIPQCLVTMLTQPKPPIWPKGLRLCHHCEWVRNVLNSLTPSERGLENLSGPGLSDELQRTLELLQTYARDLKFTKSSIITAASAPQFPKSELSNIIIRGMVDLDHVISTPV